MPVEHYMKKYGVSRAKAAQIQRAIWANRTRQAKAGNPKYRKYLRGRGWHGESLRHSLAARGYLYHGTIVTKIDRIKKDGLRIDAIPKTWAISDNYIYLTNDESSAAWWGENTGHTRFDEYGARHGMLRGSKGTIEPIVLRIDMDGLKRIGKLSVEFINGIQTGWNEGEICYVFNKNIPPELIEIKGKDGKWRKLKE